MRFLVFGTLISSIIVDQEIGTLAYASRHFAALALNVSLQFIAVFIVMHIACNNKGQAIAGASFLYGFLLYDFQFFHQLLYMGKVCIILEPANELGTFFWTNAVDAGKFVIEHAEASCLYQFFYWVTFDEFLCYIATAERNVERIEQMTTISLSALSNAFQHIGNALLAKSLPGCYLVGMLAEMIEIGIFANQPLVYQFPDSLL